MSDDNRTALVRFVASGSVHSSDQVTDVSSFMDAGRRKLLAQRLADLRAEHNIVDADAEPTDFARAVHEREVAAAAKPGGQDVPRWNVDNPVMSKMYAAHDAMVGLPHPGGLGILILAIVLLFLILIPATGAGETRTLLLWEVILGKKRIDPAPGLYASNGTIGAPASAAAPAAIVPVSSTAPSFPVASTLLAFADLGVPEGLMLGGIL